MMLPKDVKNICDRILAHAQTNPEQIALILADENREMSFASLLQEVQKYRQQLRENNFVKGDRALILFPFSADFIYLMIACFSEGIAPVLIDPRLKKSHWTNAITNSQVKGIISNRKILNLRWLWWWLFRFRLYSIDGPAFKVRSFSPIGESNFAPLVATSNSDEVLLTLTSGTTGTPKLVSRSFSILKNQQYLIFKYLPKLEKDIHLSLYGIGVLQSIVEGATTVLTTNHDPENIVRLSNKFKVTRISGPPASIEAIYKLRPKIATLENMITGGAPIPRWLMRDCAVIFPKVKLDVIYGSTECEPIAYKRIEKYDIDSQEYGYAVGDIVSELQVRKEFFARFQNREIFEILLEGENCVATTGESLWRSGDLAYQNGKGEFILVGRRSQAIDGVPAGYVEEAIERIENVKRVALIKKDGLTQLHVECQGEAPKAKINYFLENFNLSDTQIVEHSSLPVDSRHRWKIQRDLL